MSLIVKKTESNLFLFCESSDGLSYDGKIIGGNDVKLSFCEDILVVQVVDGERFNFRTQQLNYDDGIEIIGFPSMIEFIETIKVAGFTGNFNTANGGAATELSTPYKLISTASTNANVVKATAGKLNSIVAIGLTSTVRFLKLYNKATAPTVGTDVPVMTIPIPANTQGAGVVIPFSKAVNFSNGISIAITANPTDNDATAIGAGDVIINLTRE